MMDNLLLTQILAVSFIFAIVAIIGLINILRLNVQFGRIEKQKKKRKKTVDDQSNVYEFKKRK
jgi:uncharacterized membrane protein YciS (DUF1049 family)